MIEVGGRYISLDKKCHQSEIDFVSHAHTDHISAVKKSNGVIMSAETASLIKTAYNIAPKLCEINTRTLGISMLDSGHMLGAKQLFVEQEGMQSIVYTGDFTLQQLEIPKKIEIPKSDIVVIYSTYPYMEIKFNDREFYIDKMISWINKMLSKGIVLFSAYAMGKAQELNYIMNENSIIPIVSPKIARINSVYGDAGINLIYDTYQAEEHMRGNFVGIVETRDIRALAFKLSCIHKKVVYSAIASGFAAFMHFNTDAQFPISDHADFNQSMDYINQTGAREVFTYGHNKDIFAKNLKAHGYAAVPFCNILKPLHTTPILKETVC